MSNISGLVKKIFEKGVPTRKGTRTAYKVKLELDDGSETGWLDQGFEKPEFDEGDTVALTLEQNDRGYDYIASAEVTESGGGNSRQQSRGKPKPSYGGAGGNRGKPSGGGFKGGFQKDSKAIHYQNSRTAAIQLVATMLQHDALPVSAAKTKAGTATRYEQVIELVNKLTVQLFFDLETFRLLESVADAGAEQKKEPEELPEDMPVKPKKPVAKKAAPVVDDEEDEDNGSDEDSDDEDDSED